MFIISFVFFFFKQKTAYEMRISDWSSDVCSSDLHGRDRDDRAGTAAATNPRYVPAGTTRGTGTGAVHAALRERFAISLRMRLAGSRAEATSRRPSAHPHARLRGETVGVDYRHRGESGTIRAPGGVAAVRWCRYRAAVDRSEEHPSELQS